MKTLFIEKMDKPFMAIRKTKIEQDNCKTTLNLEKEKNIKKIIKILKKQGITNVVLSTEISNNQKLINELNASEINIFNGQWLKKYLSIEILNYILKKEKLKPEETEIAIAVNQINETNISIIKKIAEKYKKITIVTKHIEKLRKIEKEIYEKEGILIIISNNQKKSLSKAKMILNIDFNKELINKYKINEKAYIVNLEEKVKIEQKRFNGICINDYEIEVGREETIWRANMKKFKTKDIFESILYMRDTFESISIKISKCDIKIKEIYGVNGKIGT